MKDVGYHGSFEHPVRAFAIGVTLLVLLFGGFVLGVEAGTGSGDTVAARVVTVHGQRTLTVAQPVVRTVVSGGRTEIVQLPGSERTRVVVIHRHGRTLVAYQAANAAATGDTPGTLQTLYVAQPQTYTVTEPASTVTVSGPTETVTVTETATETTDTASDTTGP